LHSKQLEKSFGLTGPQLVVMRTISAHRDITVGGVARQVSLSQATVTNIIDRLETRGLVQRVRSSQDKRKVTVSITESGQELLDKKPTFLQEKFIREFVQLQQWEQLQILSSLQRVATMMGAEEVHADPGVLDASAIPEHNPMDGNSHVSTSEQAP
jgi:DNA-binding MarR family transcriptional regulator